MRLSHAPKMPKTAFKCSECTATFNSKTGLKEHSKKKHNAQVPRRANMKCSIEACESKFCTMPEVIKHLNQSHDQHLEYEYLDFQNETAFQKWLVRIEKETPCRFIRTRGGEKRNQKQVHYYQCSRSGHSNPKSVAERKRHLKIQGSCKIERTCSSHLVKSTKSDDDTIQVKYLSKHFCHTSHIKQLGHLRLQESDRKWLAGKLAQKIPMDVILRDVRSSLDGRLGRSHIVSKQDLRNIQLSFHLDKPALMSMVSDKEFDRITTLCKGKYSKKLAKLRTRHAASLKLTTVTAENAPGQEWLVQSATNADEMYTVARVKEPCESCGLVCHACKACIHQYTCTCVDSVTRFNMCEHIHFICMKYTLSEHTDRNGSSDEDNLAIAEAGDTHHTSEAEVLVAQVSRSISTLEQKRQRALQLCSDVVLFVQNVDTEEQLTTIIDCLKTVKPKLESVIACSNATTTFELTDVTRSEPPNKAVEPRRRLLSTKKRRLQGVSGSGALTKPSAAERCEIQNNLILTKSAEPLTSSQVMSPMPSPSTTSQKTLLSFTPLPNAAESQQIISQPTTSQQKVTQQTKSSQQTTAHPTTSQQKVTQPTSPQESTSRRITGKHRIEFCLRPPKVDQSPPKVVISLSNTAMNAHNLNTNPQGSGFWSFV